MAFASCGWTISKMPNDTYVEKITRDIEAMFAHVQYERGDMHWFQREDVEFFYETPFAFGLIDMGLGKTVTAATLIARFLEEEYAGKILVVGPISVITSSWPDEFRIWRHLVPHAYTVLREDEDDPRIGTARKEDVKARALGLDGGDETAMRVQIRHELAKSKTQIHFISFEGLEWLTSFFKAKWPYRIVFVDESSFLKTHTSNRFIALARVRNTPGLIERLYLLTATPASEGYEAFFTQMFLLDRGKTFGQYITKFRDRYFIRNQYTLKYQLRPGAKEEILEKIAPFCTVRKRADYFDVTMPQIIERRVVLTPRERNMYDTMETDCILELENGARVEAATAAALSQKLGQMASGVLYETVVEDPEGYDPDSDEEAPDAIIVKKVHHIHDHKIDALKQLVAEFPHEKILVGYQHRSSLDRLAKHFPKAQKWKKDGSLKAPWNDKKIPMMLLHPKSGSHGNNLQKGGHIVVFFDVPWSREQFTQLIGRLDRQGQLEPVLVFLLVATDTVDERIAKAQRLKAGAEEEISRIIKALKAKARRALKRARETVAIADDI